MIYSFLQDRTQDVIANGKVSKVSNVLSRAPQGSVIEPLVFLMVIDTIGDIQQSQQGLIFSCFLEDTKIALLVYFSDDATKLQTPLEKLNTW